MTQQPKHTPAPYAVGDKSKNQDAAMVYSDTNDGAIYDGVRVADCNTSMFLSKEQSEISAEFIVRACNSHYELLEALRLADAALSGSNMNMNVVQKKVRAAITKAMGE